MAYATRWEQITRLIDHYYGIRSNASSADRLHQAPRDVLVADAKTLKLNLSTSDLERIGDLLAEMTAESTKCSLSDRELTRLRIETALARMKRAYWLRRILYSAIYSLGLGFALLGLYYSVRGQWQRGLIIGGLGAANIAISITRNAVSGVRESSSDLLQLRAAYTAFFAEIDQWQHRYTSLDLADALDLKRSVADQYRQSALHAVVFIETYCKSRVSLIPPARATEGGNEP